MPCQKPAFKPLKLSLNSNSELLYRQIVPSDISHLQKGFSLLSKESRYKRFGNYISELSPKTFKYFSDVDQVNHIAWGAFDIVDGKQFGVGVGRFIRLEKEPKIAEMAITVIDSYQKKGIGWTFLAILYVIASYLEIHTLKGIILHHNYSIIEKLVNIGAKKSTYMDETQIELTVLDGCSLAVLNNNTNVGFVKRVGEIKSKILNRVI